MLRPTPIVGVAVAPATCSGPLSTPISSRGGVDQRRQRLGVARPGAAPQLVVRAGIVDLRAVHQRRTPVPVQNHRHGAAVRG